MRLLLLRHGQTPANVAGTLETSHPGPGLTPLGVRQAAAVPGVLAHENVAAVYASVLVRTQLTGTPLAAVRGFEPIVREGLHEIEAGALEGRGDRDAVRAYLETLRMWTHDLAVAMPDGPSGHDFFARFDAAIAAIEAQHDADATVAVVNHGAAIRTWVGGRARNVEPSFAVEHDLANTGLAVLNGSMASGWDLESWHAEPIGGPALVDASAHDPTGEDIDEAVSEAPPA